MNKEIVLASGRKLLITAAPFKDSKALYQSLLAEGYGLRMDGTSSTITLMKDIFCLALSSKKVEACLDECMKRVVYNGAKIDENTFEPVEAREDYLDVCFEVTQVNVAPFTKNLFARLKDTMAKLESFQA